MFNILLDYPSYDSEVEVVKGTTSDKKATVEKITSAEEILYFQNLVRKVPIADNVVEYAVKLVRKTRPFTDQAAEITNNYLEWGAGPRASQYLVLGAKCNALLNGKYSPDIEDIQSMAIPVLRHRIVRNFKAEAENISLEDIIKELL